MTSAQKHIADYRQYPLIHWLTAAILLGMFCIARADEPESAAKQVKVPPAQAALVGKGADLDKQPKAKSTNIAEERSKKSVSGVGPAVFRTSERTAADRLAAEIRDALQLRKTLVVWLVEQSPDAAALASNMADQISRITEEIGSGSAGKLETVIITYNTDVKTLTAEPVADASKLRSALATIRDKSGAAGSSAEGKIAASAALTLAVEKFLPYRQRGYEVLLVIVGASTDAEPSAADESIVALRRSAVPVYGVGPAMPFGSFIPGEKNRRPAAQGTASSDSRKFESLYPERIQLALSGNQSSADLTDSGFGPFALERNCRLTGGRLFRLRGGAPPGWELDPATGDIKSELLTKYAPDYVNEEQYQQLLSENKCRMALHNAALLPPLSGLQSVKTDFPKEKDEAALARNIKTAQQAAALVDQPIQKLYDTLVVGQSDRPNLQGARWQAAYDLAMGQTLATKARLDGYNAMLAIIKQGKAFANPESKRWVLEPADEIAAASTMDKMAKSSRTYLQRVVADHKGTPWAAIAERELKFPAGWKFVEK